MKTQIEIGDGLMLDIPTLLKTRLLIQANSGGGKSWLLRRLAEQLCGKVPVIIIDVEGEFATLREKFDYVLVGKGGETPADVRSASVVAHKLLELRASAVCDLYELKPQTRHQWVRTFLDALIDSPKQFWGPTIIIVDEAHQFCPEGKSGESEAGSAMVDLATRGRKRGFCPIYATQRLGKLRKDAAAELLNVLVGMTFIDIDRERAAECLGVSREEKHKFNDEIKLLSEGKFYGLGRALCRERTLVKVGSVQTTHPEAGGGEFAAAPPPAPAEIKKLLPKLADLPKAAEEKAKTEADLRTEIRSLKGQLAARPKQEVVKPEIVEVPILTDADRKLLKRVVDEQCGMVIASFEKLQVKQVECVNDLKKFLSPIFQKLSLPAVRPSVNRPPEPQYKLGSHPLIQKPTVETMRRAFIPPTNGDVKLGLKDMKFLSVLSQFDEGVDAGKLCLLAGYKWNGDTRNALSRLRTSGAMLGGNQEIMLITEHGRSLGPFPELPQGRDLINYWLQHQEFGQKDRSFLKAFVDNPDGLTADQLCSSTDYGWNGDTRNALSRLRTAGVIQGRNGEIMRLAQHLLELL